jgi:hypothetical protein
MMALIAAALVGGCGGGGDDDTAVPYVTLAQTQHSGFGSGEHIVLRSERELAALWARMTVGAEPVPAVDFASRHVLAVFLGSRPAGCYGMAITNVTRTTARVLVQYRESTPPPGAICTQAIVTPAHLVVVPSPTLPVEFEAE